LSRWAFPALDLSGVNLNRPPGPKRVGVYASGRYVQTTVWLLKTWAGFSAVVVLNVAQYPVNYCLKRVFIPFRLDLSGVTWRLLHRADAAAEHRRRLSSPSAEQARRADARAPVLLLRSFRDDHLVARRIDWQSRMFETSATFEEVLTEELWNSGPVVAIGEPGEAVPRAGAAREYVSHDGWQSRVQEMAAGAAMIVIVVGSTPGLGWELQRMFDLGHRDKLILVFPWGANDMSGDRRWERFVGGLSDNAQQAALLKVSVQGMLAVLFDDMGRPVVLCARKRTEDLYVLAMRVAARKVFARRGAVRESVASAAAPDAARGSFRENRVEVSDVPSTVV
jgi:hypothetical protein